MIAVLTHHWAKEGKVAEARALLDGNGRAQSRAPGFVSRVTLHSLTDPTQITSLVTWDSEEIYDRWKASPGAGRRHGGRIRAVVESRPSPNASKWPPGSAYLEPRHDGRGRWVASWLNPGCLEIVRSLGCLGGPVAGPHPILTNGPKSIDNLLRHHKGLSRDIGYGDVYRADRREWWKRRYAEVR